MLPNYRISGGVFSSFHSHEGITAREALPLEPAKSWDLRASERIGNRIPDSDTAGSKFGSQKPLKILLFLTD